MKKKKNIQILKKSAGWIVETDEEVLGFFKTSEEAIACVASLKNHNKRKSFLEDHHKNLSSKRLCGFVLVATGILFSIVLFGYSFTKVPADPETIRSIINMFLISGSGLLGIGVFEKGSTRPKIKE